MYMTTIYAIIRDAETHNLRMIQEPVDQDVDVTDYQLSQRFNYAISLSDSYCSEYPRIPVEDVWKTRMGRQNAYAMQCTINQIKEKYNVIAFSHRYGGFTHFDWNFGDNVTFHIYSNFGYGRNSDFNSTFKYKDIVLAPYSYYVKYRYSTYASVVSCTNAYELEYDQWSLVMKDCLDFYNAVVHGKDNYIFDWLNNQLSQMISGLESFLDISSYNFGEMLLNNRVSSYANVSGDDFWKVKSEKICNSLQFIENIKILPVQVDSKGYIRRLERLCSSFKPKLEAKITATSTQIDEIQQDLELLKSNKDYELYSKLKDKYYYSKGWYKNNFRMCRFLLHILKRFDPNYKIDEIRNHFIPLKEHITQIDETSAHLSSLKYFHTSLCSDLSKMNGYLDALGKE